MIKLTTETSTYFLDENEFINLCWFRMRDIEPVQKVEFNGRNYEFNPAVTSLTPHDIDMDFDIHDVIRVFHRNSPRPLVEITRDMVNFHEELKNMTL